MIDHLIAAGRLVPLCLALVFAVGCPPDDDDDDATPPAEDDDDATPDDGERCEDIDDQSSYVGSGTTFSGSTAGETADFGGSCSNGNVAEYVFSFVAPETATYLVSTINPGSDYDTLIFAFSDCENASSTELACNDDFGDGLTSQITFDATADQEIFVAIEGYDGTGNFEVSIDLVVCGDGIVAGAELCDDGNTDAGDGCDASCVWECDGEDDREDDDYVEDSTELELPADITDGYLCPTDFNADYGVYIDFFVVTVEDDEAYLSVDAGPGGTLTTECAEQNLTVWIGDAELNGVAAGAAEEGECAAAVAVPGAGTWYVGVFGGDQTIAPQDYTLTVASAISECGDGTLEGLEECDDGNLETGDGCTSGCLDEEVCVAEDGDLSDSLDGEVVTGTTVGGTDDHLVPCSAPGSPDVVFVYTAAEDGPVVFSTNNPGTDYDSAMFVRSTCEDPGPDALLDCNDDVDYNGGILASWVGINGVAGESYYVFIDGYGGEEGAFELSVTTPVCGDGEVDPNEECDDANDTTLDGCESDCTITTACAYEADEDIGALESGDNAVTFTPAGDDITDAVCSNPGGGDHSLRFEVTSAGEHTFTASFQEGTDVQFQLWGPETDCEMVGPCVDFYPELGGSIPAELDPGVYTLVIDAWEDGTEGEVALTITAP